MGDHRADVGIVRAASEAEGRGVRGIVDLAQLPARRVRQGLPAVSQRTQTAAVEAAAERDLLRALHDRLRGRRGAAAAFPRILRRHPDLVVRRLSPRWRRCLAGDGDDAEIRPAGRRPGQVPRRQCAPALPDRSAEEDHPRPRHRDRAAQLVADRRRSAGCARSRCVRDACGSNPSQGSDANHGNHQAFRCVRQRLPCRRAARALGEIPRPRIPRARKAGAVAARRSDELVSQDQRRGRPRHDESRTCRATRSGDRA